MSEIRSPSASNDMRLMVFAYNFPHKKSVDFLSYLHLHGYQVEFVAAADRIQLNLPAYTLRVNPRHKAILHPKIVCERWGIPFFAVPHDSEELIALLKRYEIDFGIIAGARILKKPVIAAVNSGIVNFHPGLIPEVRGLDTLQWAIYHDLPLGVTAHLIDERVDAGRIILRKSMEVYPDDSFVDLSLRLYETQLEMLPETLQLLSKEAIEEFPSVPKGKHFPPMTEEYERDLPEKLRQRLRNLR